MSLDKIIAGGLTFLATITFNSALAANDVIRMTAVGTTISIYQNGVPCGPTIDASIASGFPGFQAKVLTALTNGIIENWAGGIWATTVSDPTFSPTNGHYTFPQPVTITSTTPTATIFYTTDDSTPTHSSASIASGGTVVLNSAATIKAFAAVTGLPDSNIIASSYAAFFNPWVPHSLITGLPIVGTAGPGNPNVLYESNPQVISPNRDGKVFKIWYMPDTFSQGLAYAESNDGKAFTPYNSGTPVIPAVNGGFGRVYKHGSTYYAYMTGTNISAWTSPDGVVWTLANATALVPSQAWESAKLWQLNVVTVDGNGIWYGYYSGGDTGVSNTSWRMGLATSTDGIHWTKFAGNPVINYYTSNFTWAQSDSKFYGWSSNDTPIGTGSISRFVANNPSGPWTPSEAPTYYSTIVNEYVGFPSKNIVDPSILEVTTAPVSGMYLYGTKTDSGKAHGIICAIAPKVTLAQLVAGQEGVQNVPFPFSNLNLNMQAADNFTRANVNPIGGIWTPRVARNTAQIISNLATPSSAGVVADSWWNGFIWDNDQWVKITVNRCSANSVVGVALRQSTSGANTSYRFVWRGTLGSAGNFFIQKFVNGTQTNLQSAAWTLNAGDTIEAAVVGTNLWMYINGFIVNTAPVSDSAITSGSGGFAIQALTINTNAQISAFSGGNLIAAPGISHQ